MDDDNYTILDEPDDSASAPDDADDRQVPARGVRVAVIVGVVGILTICLAGIAGASQQFVFDENPDRFRLFINAVTLPLSIVGALLVVLAVVLFVLREQLLPDEPTAEAELQDELQIATSERTSDG